MQIMKPQILSYLNNSSRCINPNCLSGNIEGGSVEVDAGGATQDISCLDCDSTWTDLYKLDYVINIDIQEKK